MNKPFFIVVILSITSFLSLTAQIQVGQDLIGTSVGDGFGYSVSLSADGSKAAMGAILYKENQNILGQAKVFALNQTP